MKSLLATLRQTPQPDPARFLAAVPGCWIQYYDDTEAKDTRKALSTRSFDPALARRKQQEHCAACFSLQAFGEARTREELLCFRNLGVDIDLVPLPERGKLSREAIDRRKDEYLERCLLPFPLRPHWLMETAHGFHAVFRIQPLREESDIHDALAINRRLVTALQGDLNAVLLTQVLRVPGTYQFKDPEHPFLCRLLMDNASAINPYELGAVRRVLDEREPLHRVSAEVGRGNHTAKAAWEAGLDGVPEGSRNPTAAAIVGAILARLPEPLWETAGHGGLREWNRRNPVPLPDRELRSVFESIARRERAKRGRHRHAGTGSVDAAVEGANTTQTKQVGDKPDAPGTLAPTPSPRSSC